MNSASNSEYKEYYGTKDIMSPTSKHFVWPRSDILTPSAKMKGLVSEFRSIDSMEKTEKDGLRKAASWFYEETFFCCSCQKHFFKNNGGK